MHSRLTRLYYFLAGKWLIPLEPGHYLDLLVLLVLTGLLAFLTLWQGGMSAEALPWAARIFAVALSFHVFALVQRAKTGFGLRPAGMIFLPWLAWVLLDWLFFSPQPWLAEIELITSIMVFGVFGLSLYHFRHDWLRWIIGGITVAFVSVAASLALGDQQHMMRTLLGKNISPVYDNMFSGTLGHPAAIGALLLMAFFPSLAVLLSRRWGLWQRLLAAYFSVILAIGIFSTHHIGVWLGFLIGVVIISSLLIRKIAGRISLILITLLVMYLGLSQVRMDVGCLRQTGQTASSQTPPLINAAWDSIKQAPLQGMGQGGFAGAFESNRPGKWETTPATPGSLPLAVLAENGIIGFLLLLGPACWIWFSGLSTCLRLPFYEKPEKDHSVILSVRKQNGKRVTRMIKEDSRIMPDPRIALGGLLAGTAAAGVLAVIDYPAAMPVVACFFAINGASILRLTEGKVVAFHAKSAPMRAALGAAVVLKPAVWLLWVLAPLTAASLAEQSSQRLHPYLPSLDNPNEWYLTAPKTKELLTAREDAFRATQANPFNGDAWYWYSLASLRLYTINPGEGAELGDAAYHASQRAVDLAPANPDFLIARGTSLLMRGERENALAMFKEAVNKAPYNLPALLTLSDILGQRSDSRQAAVEILHLAETLNPDHAYIKQRLSFLQLGAEKQPASAHP